MQVDVDGLKWNLQKHRIPGFTPYIKGLELTLNFLPRVHTPIEWETDQ